SVVFGLLDFLNLAHATFYMISAYIALTITQETGSFWLALLVAPIVVVLIGIVFYQILLKRLQGSHMKQVLVTFGLIFVGLDAVRMIWGQSFHTVAEPALLAVNFALLDQTYPAYRFFIIGVGLLTVVLLYL